MGGGSITELTMSLRSRPSPRSAADLASGARQLSLGARRVVLDVVSTSQDLGEAAARRP